MPATQSGRVYLRVYQTGSRSHFSRLDQRELALCLLLNQSCRSYLIERSFSLVSRLGDGVFWYVLIAALPVSYGHHAWKATVHMALVALAGVIVYKLIKPRLLRARPFSAHAGIPLGAAPLDQYSFPSGHTLHAVAFTIVGTSYYPELAWLLVPFSTLVAASRVVLGLHYPTDVMAGATIGALVAAASFSL